MSIIKRYHIPSCEIYLLQNTENYFIGSRAESFVILKLSGDDALQKSLQSDTESKMQ